MDVDDARVYLSKYVKRMLSVFVIMDQSHDSMSQELLTSDIDFN